MRIRRHFQVLNGLHFPRRSNTDVQEFVQTGVLRIACDQPVHVVEVDRSLRCNKLINLDQAEAPQADVKTSSGTSCQHGKNLVLADAAREYRQAELNQLSPPR